MDLCDNGCNACLQKLCAHKVPIFSSLNYKHLKEITKLIEHKTYSKGDVLLIENDLGDSIIIINKGSAKAVRYSQDGREQILHVLMEGDFFGEQFLFSNQRASYSVEALEEVSICLLTKVEFKKLLSSSPDIAMKVIEELGNRLVRLENSMKRIGVKSIDSRIGQLLMDFSHKYGNKTEMGIEVHLPLSREGMSNYLGIARETMSRKLSQLETDQVIRSEGNKIIVILDEAKLIELSEM
ncbi:MAG: Crp/Fnr family transcriptional regulator [Eubacteriales bacterium]|nr:Crp/Fnr family transcriptional regulator [Eubacteriales bacterium]